MVGGQAMKPRTTHLIILALLCLAPTGFGAFLAWKGEQSHADISGVAVALGLALIGASVLYAGVSSALVWKFGATPARVIGVHGTIIGLSVMLFIGSRLLSMVAS
jgi:hypothetical protein